MRIVRAERPGLSRARNARVVAALGRILVFTTDDCYVAEDVLSAYWLIFDGSDPGYAGGRVLLYDKSAAQVAVRESIVQEVIPADSFFAHGNDNRSQHGNFGRAASSEVPVAERFEPVCMTGERPESEGG